MKPSPQQANIYTFVEQGKGSALVEAVAGAGKTTTLVHAVSLMTGTVAFMAYNKKIASEIEERVKKAATAAQVSTGTVHSFGFRALRRVIKNLRVEDKKLYNIVDETSMTVPKGLQGKVPKELQGFVVKAVSLAKQRGIGIHSELKCLELWEELVDHFDLRDELQENGQLDEAIDHAIRVLERSNMQTAQGIIDFDDMIYGPLRLGLPIFQNDWVLVDEAQDTNPTRRMLARKMLRPGGRLIAVGDSRQAIYGFTGADSDAMERIAAEFNCKRLPLTITYRCPKAVVRLAQTWVNHIEAAETAPEGIVRSLSETLFEKLHADNLGPDDAVLCRNTKPLVAFAYHLIRRSIPCHVEGRDIGKGLLALCSKWQVGSLAALTAKLEEYYRKECERLVAAKQENRIEGLTDKIETLFVMMEALPGEATVNDLRSAITKLFEDTPPGVRPRSLTLSTVHKAKGREWDKVYLLGRNRYMPSPYAKQSWQMLQEYNIMYVAVTRAKQELVEVIVETAAAAKKPAAADTVNLFEELSNA